MKLAGKSDVFPETKQKLNQSSMLIPVGGKNLQDLIHRKITRTNQPNPPFGREVEKWDLPEVTNDIAFSPDGETVASGGHDRIIRIWDMKTMTMINSMSGHLDEIYSLDFSPEGTVLASAGGDSIIKLWDVKSGVILHNLTGISDYGTASVFFSPTGTELASGDEDGTIKIWNVTDGELLETLRDHIHSVETVAFSPDGTLLASGDGIGGIFLWNTTTWRKIRSLPSHSLRVWDLKFSPDSNLLASTSEDGTIRIWDITNKYNLINTFDVPVGFGNRVDFSPDGSMLASAMWEDTIIRFWDLKSGLELDPLIGHTANVIDVAFSPDGTLLASCSEDRTIRLWNLARGAELHTLTKHSSAVSSVAFSPDGTRLASASDDNTISFWNTTNGNDLQPLLKHDLRVFSVAFSFDGKVLASCSADKSVKLWNVTSGGLISNFTDHDDFVSSVAFSPDGTTLVSGSLDFTIKYWNVTSETLIETVYDPAGVRSITFSPNGTLLASGSYDIGKIVLWNVTSEGLQRTRELREHSDGVNSVSFSPNGKFLASGSKDWTIIIWDMINGGVKHNLTNHNGSVTSVAFTPNGEKLVSGSSDGTIKVWDVSSGQELQTFYLHNVVVTSIAISPDGKMIASGDTNSNVKLWAIDGKPDYDQDGMSDRWELSYDFDPAYFWDKFHDTDNDHLMNSLESFIGTNPKNIDTDGDKMPDGWEYLAELNATLNDALSDSDEDNMSNLYEYQMRLNPRINDAAIDKDGDGLTNLQEYNFGSWANQSDTDLDGMNDYYENLYEFNATDSRDASGDADGDLIRNLDEVIAGSNPRNFWSVPPISFSILHIVAGIIISSLVVLTVLSYRKKWQNQLVTRFNAPDYTTALLIQSSGYSDYSTYIQAGIDAQVLVEEGTASYYQGNPVKAIQLYEQALTIFEHVKDEISKAKIIYYIARIQKERHELTTDSSILKLFPPTPYDDDIIEAINYMLEAQLAEAEKNWGLANKSWQEALSYEGLDIELRLISQGSLLNWEIKDWLDNPIESSRETLLSHLNDWEEACQINQQIPNICQAYLFRARISFASFQFEEVEKWLKQCSELAEKNNISIYQEIARKETKIFFHHKEKIQEEIQKPVSAEEQARVLQEYIKEAVDSLRKEGLM
jgi:WD40 repeat protein